MGLARPIVICLLAAALARAEEAPPSLEFVHADCVMGVAFSPDGVTAASCDNAHLIRVWSALSGKELITLRGHESHVASIRFTPDGRHLISGSYDNTVRIWDVETGKQLWRSADHGQTVYKVRVTNDGRFFATASTREVLVWDTATRRRLLRLAGADPCAFSHDGRYIAAEFGSSAIVVYEVATGARVQDIEPAEERGISSLAFTPDGRGIVAGLRNGDVVVHDVVSGARVRKLSGHTQSARGLAISPDGRLVASGSWDTSVRVWELATGSELAHLTTHTGYVLSLAFSPEGTRLLTGARDRRAILWDLGAWLRERAAPEFPAEKALHATPAQLARWWEDLASRDARRAFTAIWALVGAEDRAVVFLAEPSEFQAAAAPPTEAIDAFVRDLDAPSAAVRDRAVRWLGRHGAAAEASLERARRDADSPEVRRLAAELLEELSPLGGWRFADLRLVRAIHVLEQIRTAAARRLLMRLADELDPRVGREARLALRRLDDR